MNQHKSKELTAEEQALLDENLAKFQKRILEGFGIEGTGELKCEYENCSCGNAPMKIDQFNVVVTPAPDLNVMAVCKSAAIDVMHKVNMPSIFDPRLN